ncbi:hypothetical protein CALVIDRAFT_203509 [Calocera viscosa TUFC12733]|uniref:F-box domain-containing protein n=1 Tax=Calocera viscosa (strain TUFC12733) TaxID=1330018 RepID=A0A167KC76_CALVF|nr:hypothetical protein CALVIDRAFT_203509 [Calocera viscosa TUFC12733]
MSGSRRTHAVMNSSNLPSYVITTSARWQSRPSQTTIFCSSSSGSTSPGSGSARSCVHYTRWQGSAGDGEKELAYRLLYVNLRFCDSEHVSRFLRHVEVQTEREDGTRPNLATTRRLLLCLRHYYSSSRYREPCSPGLFCILPRLKQVIALEALPVGGLAALNRCCGHSLEQLELVIDSDSLDTTTVDSFNELKSLKQLSATFLMGKEEGVRIETGELHVSLPTVYYLKLLFITWHRSADVFFTAFNFPALTSLYISDSLTVQHASIDRFFTRHRAAVTDLDINTRPTPLDAWSLHSLSSFTRLRCLTLRWVPNAFFCKKLPPSLEELRIPMFRFQPATSRRNLDPLPERGSFDSQWAFLTALLASPPAGLKIVRGRNIYVGPGSWLLDWSNVSRTAEPASAEQFIDLAAALEQKEIQLLDWRGERASQAI